MFYPVWWIQNGPKFFFSVSVLWLFFFVLVMSNYLGSVRRLFLILRNLTLSQLCPGDFLLCCSICICHNLRDFLCLLFFLFCPQFSFTCLILPSFLCFKMFFTDLRLLKFCSKVSFYSNISFWGFFLFTDMIFQFPF